MRDFNTAGPVRPEDHYCVPPLNRVNLSEVLSLVRRKRYFVLYAPRQTGKTSALLALRDLLNGGSVGNYRCGYINIEIAETARENIGQAMGRSPPRSLERPGIRSEMWLRQDWRTSSTRPFVPTLRREYSWTFGHMLNLRRWFC